MILNSCVSKRKLYYLFWIVLIAVSVIYNEFLVYYLNSKHWYNLKCKDEKQCTKILLVADPQIIGNNNEIIHFLTPLTIYDSDRYLKTTYSYVYNFVKPGIVVLLGDLMDEAHTASDSEFYQYVRRVFNIFLDSASIQSDVKHIWLPGDNDIGGEDTKVTPKKLQRFERAFSQPSLINFRNITFFKSNSLTSIIPVYKKEREFYDTSRIFIGLSHVPLMFRPSTFADKVISKMLPHLIFSAHDHKSMIINTDALLRQDYHVTPVTPDNNKIFKFTLGVQDMYEIIIPTCSYRMGTSKIGYGFAILENNELIFTVLWSPSRFDKLAVYLTILTTFLIVSCCLKASSVCNAVREASRKFIRLRSVSQNKEDFDRFDTFVKQIQGFLNPP